MCAQIPIMIVCLEHITQAIFLNWFLSLSAFFVAYYLARQALFQLARGLLLIGYLNYVTLASLLWLGNLHIQHFLLLGLIGCGCLFKPRESFMQHSWALAFLMAFIAVSVLKTNGERWQDHLQLSNSLTLSGAVFLTYYSIVQVSQQYWQQWKSQHQKVTNLVNQLFPQWDGGKLSVFCPQPTKQIPFCAVLFADMSGYTQLSVNKGDLDTVNTLNLYYQQVDQLAKQFSIEKIKTNGDQYIAVAGLTFEKALLPSTNPIESICHFAHQLHILTAKFNQTYDTIFALRIGIASGPIIAGVIGRLRPSFDIWGNTVNLAAELEQTCPTQRILVCEQTAKSIHPPLSAQSMQTTLKKHHSAIPYLLNTNHCPTI